MANIFGRQVVVPLVNKSGGSVAAGDVVIVDTSNDGAFTTTTSGGFTGTVGVAQETIASNATGRVLTAGYAALINVNASVTRGQYGKTHTVVKQATGTSVRGVGTFCQWLTGGTTPTAMVYPADLNASAGNVATDAIWDAAGDLAVGTGADTAAKLTLGATGTAPISTGSTLAYTYPPGYEYDYAERTTAVNITNTGATPDTIVTGNAVTYDGSTKVIIEFVCDQIRPGATAGQDLNIFLYDGSTKVCYIGYFLHDATNAVSTPGNMRTRLTPSAAAHTYSIRAAVSGGTGSVSAGSGTGGAEMPAYIRIIKV